MPVKDKTFYSSPSPVIDISSTARGREIGSRDIGVTLYVTVQIDCTNLLIEGGNGYRKSKAKKLAEDSVRVMIQKLGLKRDFDSTTGTTFNLVVEVYLKWNGKFREVASEDMGSLK